MLEYDPYKRISALESLPHKWLTLKDDYDYKMSEEDYETFLQQTKKSARSESNEDEQTDQEIIDSDVLDADNEDYDELSEDSLEETNVEIDRRFLDRSFTNQRYGYIGYGDGIQLNELDIKGNWQFECIDK